MLISFRIAKHDQWIIIQGNRVILFNCSCPDFLIRKLPKRKEDLEMCKHLRELKRITELNWERITIMDIGQKKISPSEKEVYRKMVNNKCQGCKIHEDEVGQLQAHRIKRGNKGGTYAPNNVLMLCTECHKVMHQGEFT